MNSHQYIQGTPMAPESTGITRCLSPHTPSSSILPYDLSDGTVTGERSTDGNEFIEVPSQSGFCTQCL